MRTKCLTLHRDCIRTHSLWAWWYKNDQMWHYSEREDGLRHGDFKSWWRDGQSRWHYIYEKGELVKS